MKATIELLRGLREDKDLKQSDIADLIGTTQQQYSKYETGESELPLRAFVVLADYYNVSTDYLMGRTDSRQGITAINETITVDSTAGSLLTDVLSLDDGGRRAVIEYVYLQRLKMKYGKQGL